jgi:hypothetical protein
VARLGCGPVSGASGWAGSLNRRALPSSIGVSVGRARGCLGHPMVIVDGDVGVVERDLCGGRLRCSCGGVLRPWGWARPRVLRCRSGDEVRVPRRARCRGCGGTHVLLGDRGLLRRRDEIEVIGEALWLMIGAGHGHRWVAEGLGLPAGTVRWWRRAFLAGAEVIRAHFTRWAHALDPQLGRMAVSAGAGGDALEAIAVAVRAWVLRLGSRSFWPLVSALSGGVLLCNTSCPFPAVR